MKRILCLCLALTFSFNSRGQQQNLYGLDTIQEIRIRFSNPDWHYVLDSFKRADDNERLIGDCTLNGVPFDSIGVRYKGNSSYNNIADQDLSKLPFNIKLNDVKSHQNYQGYTTLKLSNGFRDPSFLREVISYELLRSYLAAPKANFIKVYVNDTYLGLYTNVESLNSKFLEKTFGTSNGNFFKCDPDYHALDLPDCLPGKKSSLQYLGNDSTCYFSKYERKSDFPDDWEQLIRLCRRLNHQPEKLEQILNINEVLWMLAFNNVLVNLDSYTGRLCHNYYLFRDSTGQFRPLIWDLNMSFGGFPYAGDGKPLSVKEMQELNPLFNFNSEARPLISKILNNPTYRRMYIDHMQVILDDFMHYDAVTRRLEKIQRLIYSEVLKDKNKFYTDEAFKANLNTSAQAGKLKIAGIRELMNGRIEYLQKNPLFQYDRKSLIQSASHKITKTDITEISIMAKAQPNSKVYLYYRLSPNSAFEVVQMKDDGKSGDTRANDGKFAFTVDSNEIWMDYFIYAENEKAGAFFPAHAQREVLEVR